MSAKWKRISGLLLTLSLALTLGGCFSDLSPSAHAWEDANCNGRPDQSEVPLSGVCIWYGTKASAPMPQGYDCTAPSNVTSNRGDWHIVRYYRSCDQIYVFAVTPDGYQPTTDLAVHTCGGGFGFAKTGTCPAVAVVDQAGLVAQESGRQVRSRIIYAAILVVLVLAGGMYVRWRRKGFI